MDFLMMLYLYILLSVLFFKLCESNPIIFENLLHTCYYNSSTNNGNIAFTSKIWTVQLDDIIIKYTLCGHLPEQINCGLNTAACLIDNYNSSHIIGKNIILETNDYQNGSFLLKFVSGDLCKTKPPEKYKVTVKFKCDQKMKEVQLERKSECEYNIYMVHPNCSVPCVAKIGDQFIDFRELKGNYFLEEKGVSFSISLCNATPNCTKNYKAISVCKKSKDGILPISSSLNEKIIYHPHTNEIVYRGSYKGDNGIKKFELLLKCNWDNSIGQIKHKEVPIQGKDYKFVMDSSYGCVKFPPKCVVTDKSLVYNLTNLSNSSGYLVANMPSGSLYINICGPLHFKFENSCSRSFSQVCEIRNGKYLNRGSILSKLDVIDDVVKATYSNGMKCQEDPSRQYSTHIDFFCSKTDKNPMFVVADKCDLFLNWTTSQACPFYEKSNCEYKRHENQACSTVFEGHNYDLSSLKKYDKNYEIIDPKNNRIKYFLNICGLLMDTDIPCLLKDSMVIMKNLEEANIKHRFKSLGKMDSINVINGQIFAEAVVGTYCGVEGDYSSSIRFICSNNEEPPRLVNWTECTFQFEWKTPHACLNKAHSNDKQCLTKGFSDDTVLDISKSKPTSLKIALNELYYVFDLCKDNYKECMENGQCEQKPVTKNVFSNNGSTYLELFLPKSCDAENDINKVMFELVCHNKIRNDFKQKDLITNCTVQLMFYTNLVCDKEEYQIDHKEENEKYDMINENIPKPQEHENCSIINHITDYKIYISSLHLNISIDLCPTVLFYEHNSSVILVYPKSEICNKSNDKAPFEYKAILMCSNQEMHNVMKMDCLELHHLKGTEFCKLFESSALDVPKKNNNTVIIVSSIIGIVFFLGICLFCFYKWRKRSSYRSVYEKDGDL